MFRAEFSHCLEPASTMTEQPAHGENRTAQRLATVLLVAMALLFVGGVMLWRTASQPAKSERSQRPAAKV